MKKKRGWTAAQRAKFRATMQKRRYRKGAEAPEVRTGPNRTQEAVIFLKKMEVEIAKRMSLSRARSIDRVALYGLLALDALTGEP